MLIKKSKSKKYMKTSRAQDLRIYPMTLLNCFALDHIVFKANRLKSVLIHHPKVNSPNIFPCTVHTEHRWSAEYVAAAEEEIQGISFFTRNPVLLSRINPHGGIHLCPTFLSDKLTQWLILWVPSQADTIITNSFTKWQPFSFKITLSGKKKILSICSILQKVSNNHWCANLAHQWLLSPPDSIT